MCKNACLCLFSEFVFVFNLKILSCCSFICKWNKYLSLLSIPKIDLKFKKIMCIHFLQLHITKTACEVYIDIERAVMWPIFSKMFGRNKQAHQHFILLQTGIHNLCLKVIVNFCACEIEWLDSLLVFCQASWGVLVTWQPFLSQCNPCMHFW